MHSKKDHGATTESNDNELVDLALKNGMALANAAKFIAAKHPDVKEAVTILIQTAVEKIVAQTHPNEVLSELVDQFSIDRTLAHEIVSNLITGEPKAGFVVRAAVRGRS